MPAKSKAQFRFMEAASHNPEFAKKVGIKPEVAKEYTSENTGNKRYAKLKERLSKK
jgi:hypothetical protein